MAGSKPISLGVIDLAEESARRLDQWKSTLLLLDADAVVGISKTDFLGIELRAAAVVATMAEVERLLREFLIGLGAEVNSSRTEIRHIVAPLRALVAHSSFESISNTKQAEVAWSQRQLVTSLEGSTAYALLPTRVSKGAQPPLDGKTITDAHVLRLWAVLGIPGSPFPVPECATSLKRLASLRNDIAHANQPVDEVLLNPGTSGRDLERHIDHVQLLVLNMASELSDYVKRRKYRLSL